MVNQIIVDYLKNYSNQFPLKQLKQKIIASGYSEQEVNEAVSFLNLTTNAIKTPNMATASINLAQTTNYSGFKWMKFAGICGVILLIITFILVIASFWQNSINFQESSKILSIILVIAAIILFLITIFFIYGFVKIGKSVNSKLLVFSSWALIIILILSVIFIISSTIIMFVWAKSFLNFSPSIAGIPAINTLDLTTASVSMLILSIGIALFILAIIVLFNISLIKAGKQVKLSKSAGILGISLLSLLTIFYIVTIINPILLLQLVMSNSGKIIYIILQIILMLMNLVYILFLTLSLFDSSKTFEQTKPF